MINILIFLLIALVLYNIYYTRRMSNNLLLNNNSFSFSKSFKTSKVPFLTFNYDDGINKPKELTFLVDTGANVNFIQKETVEKLDPDLFKNVELDDDVMTIAGVVEQNSSIMLTLSLSNCEYEDRFVLCNNNDSFKQLTNEYGKQIDGIIGSEFLKKYNFDINYKHLNITLQ